LRQIDLVLNSIGTPGDRASYIDQLRTFLRTRIDDLAADDREKVESHPMRVLDSKRPESQAVVADAPLLVDALSASAADHFERVQRGLTAARVPYRIDPRLVRGLDYYTHTAFEFQSSALGGAQNTIGGGGRYDGLSESLGGPPTPGIGFGSGIERVLATCDAEHVFPPAEDGPDVFVVDTTGGSAARDLTIELRRAGLSADRAFRSTEDERSMRSQMKAADRSGASVVAIVGPDELAAGTVALRDLRGGGEQTSVARQQVVAQLGALLGRPTPTPGADPVGAAETEDRS
jgi:histidyl-tRNA synthetase